MEIIVILLVVGGAAMAVLLGCLRGFSRAFNQDQVVGFLMREQESFGGRQYLKMREPLNMAHSPRQVNDTTRLRPHISKNTRALVELAILLSGCSDGPARTLRIPDRDSKSEREKNFMPGEDDRRTILDATVNLHA